MDVIVAWVFAEVFVRPAGAGLVPRGPTAIIDTLSRLSRICSPCSLGISGCVAAVGVVSARVGAAFVCGGDPRTQCTPMPATRALSFIGTNWTESTLWHENSDDGWGRFWPSWA